MRVMQRSRIRPEVNYIIWFGFPTYYGDRLLILPDAKYYSNLVSSCHYQLPNWNFQILGTSLLPHIVRERKFGIPGLMICFFSGLYFYLTHDFCPSCSGLLLW